MATAHPDRTDPTAAGGEPVLVVRRTRVQWLAGALGWSLCAAPVVVVALVAGSVTPALLAVAGLVAVVAFGLDLVVRRDVHVEISPSGLRFGGRSVPWWAVDEVAVRRRAGVSRLQVTAFGAEVLVLPAPRGGPVVRNRHFDEDAALVQRAWRSLHGPRGATASLRRTPGETAGGGDERPAA